jgi:hypothetical protein
MMMNYNAALEAARAVIAKNEPATDLQNTATGFAKHEKPAAKTSTKSGA